MSNIAYPANTVFGPLVAEMVDHVVKAQQLAARIKSKADSIAAGGAHPEYLEVATDPTYFALPSGVGAAFYAAIAAFKVNVATVTAASLADLDNGA